MENRELTLDEQAVIDLLIRSETVCEDGHLTTYLEFTPEGLDWIVTSNTKYLIATKSPAKGMVRVYFTKEQFLMHLKFCCDAVGFQVSIDGVVKNKDSEVVLRLTAT